MIPGRAMRRQPVPPPRGLAGARPVAATAFVVAVALASLLINNPVQTFILLALILGLLHTSVGLGAALTYVRVGLYAGVFLLVINPLLVPGGVHVLWNAALGPLDLSVTLEGLLYGAGQFVRLLTLVLAFALYSVVLEPDDQLALMSRFSFRSGLVASLATRLFPVLSRDAQSIADAQRCRGIELDAGNRRMRVAARIPMLSALVTQSLDRACEVAAAMETRGYGRAARTSWNRHRHWRLCDRALALLSLAVIGLLLAGLVRGAFKYDFFPRLDAMGSSLLSPWWLSVLLLILTACASLSAPVVRLCARWLR
jgi:energy-coupling factor transport system permease protein